MITDREEYRQGDQPDGSAYTTTHILFDVDGTLIDSRPAIVAAYRHAFATVLGIEWPTTQNQVRELMAPRMQEVCAQVAGERGPECEVAYRAFYLEQADRLVTVLPGARELLDGLVDRGMAIGMVTNKGRERLGPDLRRAGLDHVPLAAVVCSEDTVDRKPHPAPLLAALGQAGCHPAAAMYVGDGPQDMLAAAGAGVRAIGAAYGYYGAERLREHEPHAIIERPEHLLALLDRARSG